MSESAQYSPATKTPSKSGRAVFIACLLAGLVVALVLHRYDPSQHGFYPRCQLYSMTGLQCPGCGGLRALHALLHGQVAAAFRANPLFVLSLPIPAVIGVRWLMRKRRDPAARFVVPMRWVWVGLALFILFGIVRNLPGVPAVWGGT